MKRILSIAVIFLTLLFLCSCNEEELYPQATEYFYVNDFADIIPDSDRAEIISKAASLAEATTAQVVVVTVDNLKGEAIENYALELGRLWGVGDEEKDNGIVILLSVDEREVYISVGYGLEGALPDSKTGRIIDVYGLEYFKQDEFAKGLKAVSEAIINEVYIEYGLEPQTGYISIDNVLAKDSLESEAGEVIISWIIMLVVLILISMLRRRRGGGFIGFIGGPHIGGSSFRGGSFGSGGSFGGFRGGGGSFGGGGAGRGF